MKTWKASSRCWRMHWLPRPTITHPPIAAASSMIRRQMGRHFAIKPPWHLASHVPPEARRLPEDLCQPIEPRVGALIEFFRYFGLNPGGFRYFLHQAAVEQLPSQAVGQQLGDPSAPASVLPRNGYDAKHFLSLTATVIW